MITKKRGRPNKKNSNTHIQEPQVHIQFQNQPYKQIPSIQESREKIQQPLEAQRNKEKKKKEAQKDHKCIQKQPYQKAIIKNQQNQSSQKNSENESILNRNRKTKKKKAVSEAIEFKANYIFENQTSSKVQTISEHSERPARLRKSKFNLAEEQQSEAQQQHQQSLTSQSNTFLLNPKIESLIWKTHEGQQKYLTKFSNRSYLHCKWFTKQQLKSLKFEFTHSVIKSLNAKMRKTANMKLKQNVYFNPNYVKVDRILSSAEMITAIDHRIVNQIKGHWSEGIFLVCWKLLNFYKNNYPYCLHLYDPFDQEDQDEFKTTNIKYLGQIFNQVSLMKYQNYDQFWNDLGTSIASFIKLYTESTGDLTMIGVTIREAAVFLYYQWFYLSKDKYKKMKNQLVNKKILDGDELEQMQQNSFSTIKFKIKQEIIYLNETFCKQNILANYNIEELPVDSAQLDLFHPGDFNLDWLQHHQQKPSEFPQFYKLQIKDLQQLDLNHQIKRLFLIKWKELSYKEMTWQTEDVIDNKAKIEEFYAFNKHPSTELQNLLSKQLKIHLSLLEYYQKNNEKAVQSKNDKICRFRNELYLLTVKEERKQYGNDNIPIFKNYRRLKDFQLESLNWMIKNWHQNRNLILADQMGLGKTIQTIAFLYHLYTYEKVLGPFLIISPLTTLHQWRKQVQDWTNFNCLLYYDQGTSQIRELIRNFEFYHMNMTKSGELQSTNIPKFHVLLTSYQLFLKDYQILKQIAFQHMVLDEAHKLKNKNSKITTTLSRHPCCRKTLLTGTPIQNNTKQLWTLLNFIEPLKFSSDQDFQDKYGKLETDKQVKQFRTILKPYLLRRIKEDVETTIPKLSQLIISVEMTNQQKKYYRGLVQKNKYQMIKGLSSANFNSISIQLRKCCNHPYLIAPQIQVELKKNCKSVEQQNEVFMKSSGKIILLLKLLQKFKREGKKVLVFSQFVMMLDLMKPFLQAYSFNCEILKGSQTSTIRHQAITRFNEQSQKTDVFLISTKAGGVGINLISASQVIIYDSDWNPQNDIQATARAHRIGQKKQVTVYRLITASSYESQMFKISSRKLGLDKAVFTGQFFKSSNGSLADDSKLINKDDIETLLKKGIIGFLQNEKNNEEQYFNQSIEYILQKNTKRIQYNTAQTTFSKTTFKAEQTNNISIDAPDFWEVTLKNVQTPIDKIAKKTTQLKEFDTPQKQQQLLVEAYHLCYLFVKQKTLNSGFNAEDESQLIKFFRAIQNERNFHKKFRQISNDFIEEIQKPSRRFRVKLEDLYLIKPNQKQTPQEQKSIEDQLKSSNTQQIPQRMDEEVRFQMKKQKQTKQIDQEANLHDKFEQLCNNCWRPKCIIFCKGPCARKFHKKCWEKYQNNDEQRTPLSDILQRSLTIQVWKTQINTNEQCKDCRLQNYNFECGICLNKGTFDLQINKHKERYKKHSGELSSFMIFKCNMRNCNKFYHLRCLFSEAYAGRFADKAGKVVKDIRQKSIIFRCPAHYCFACYGKEVQPSKSRPITCALCSLTYHLKCMNENQYVKVRRSTYICSKHLNIKFEVILKEELRLFNESKQSHKKQNKQVRHLKQSIQNRILKLKQKTEKTEKKPEIAINKQAITNTPKQEMVQQKQQKQNVFKYSYRDFGLISIKQFEFSQYKGDWCRYCGSRFTQTFKKGPWGNRKLCYHHYVSWKKNKLQLANYKNGEPNEPIDKGRDTEIKYLNLMQQQLNLKPQDTILKLKEMMQEQKIKSETKKESKKEKQKYQNGQPEIKKEESNFIVIPENVIEISTVSKLQKLQQQDLQVKNELQLSKEAIYKQRQKVAAGQQFFSPQTYQQIKQQIKVTSQDECGLDEAIDFIELQQHELLEATDEVRV